MRNDAGLYLAKSEAHNHKKHYQLMLGTDNYSTFEKTITQYLSNAPISTFLLYLIVNYFSSHVAIVYCTCSFLFSCYMSII